VAIETSKVDGKKTFEVWLSYEGSVFDKLLYDINISFTGSPMQRRPTRKWIGFV
jgi:hypothetical protein